MFRVTPLTEQINSRQYAIAAASLAAAIAKREGNLAAAARDVGVNYRTMTRWLAALSAAGHDVRTAVEQQTSKVKPRAQRVSSLQGKTADEQRKTILAEAKAAGGNLADVARRVGISRQAIYKKVAALRIEKKIEAIRSDPELVVRREPQISVLQGLSFAEQKHTILEKAREAGGNLDRIARAVGVSRRVIEEKIEAFKIARRIDSIRRDAVCAQTER
jgi:transcriptional regulator of acetoin/glycerol metabolism